jgi:hypothetical protein
VDQEGDRAVDACSAVPSHSSLIPLLGPIGNAIIDASSRYAFVTLRGGGLFVVDARATPMAIVGEYDQHTVRGNGCGGSKRVDTCTSTSIRAAAP